MFQIPDHVFDFYISDFDVWVVLAHSVEELLGFGIGERAEQVLRFASSSHLAVGCDLSDGCSGNLTISAE